MVGEIRCNPPQEAAFLVSFRCTSSTIWLPNIEPFCVIKMDSELLKKKYRTYREVYDPRRKGKNIRVLFIAESPPASKNKENLPYFYNKDSQRKTGALWWYFNQVLYGEDEIEKEKFLRRFQDDGYFLIDVFQTKQELIDIREEVKLEEVEW